MLFAEEIGPTGVVGIVIGVLGALGTLAGVIYGLWAKEQARRGMAEAEEQARKEVAESTREKRQAEKEKEDSEEERKRLSYLFSQYQGMVESGQAKLRGVESKVDDLQKDHTHCREEVAALKERLSILEKKG